MSSRRRVLVIDDDPAFLGLMDELIKNETRYEVLVCEGGSDALSVMHTTTPDVVILDIHMQGNIDGEEILEAIRNDELLYRVPVIVCTVDAEFLRNRALYLERLNCDWLEKPFDLEALLAKVNQALDESSAMTPDSVSDVKAGCD